MTITISSGDRGITGNCGEVLVGVPRCRINCNGPCDVCGDRGDVIISEVSGGGGVLGVVGICETEILVGLENLQFDEYLQVGRSFLIMNDHISHILTIRLSIIARVLKAKLIVGTGSYVAILI